MNVRADLFARPRVRRVLWGAFTERLARDNYAKARTYINAVSALARAQPRR